MREISVKASLLTSPAERPCLQRFQFRVKAQLTENFQIHFHGAVDERPGRHPH